jgi:tRNA(fMet)-specific endonuclease VapC
VGVLIDTSVLIEHERGRLIIDPFLSGREEEFFLSVVSASELLHGVHRANSSPARARRAAWVEAILERFPLLSIELGVARAHAQLWAQLRSEGRTIGAHDLWIAASCLAHGLILVTANVREFERVAGLRIEHWNVGA